jgi:hypothetical protein
MRQLRISYVNNCIVELFHRFWTLTERSTVQLLNLIKDTAKEGIVFNAIVDTCAQNSIDDAQEAGASHFSLMAVDSEDPTHNLTLAFTGFVKIDAGYGRRQYELYEDVSPTSSSSSYRLFDVMQYIVCNLSRSAGFYCVAPKNTPVFNVIVFTVNPPTRTATVHALQSTPGQSHPFNAPLWAVFKSTLTKVTMDIYGYTVSYTYSYILPSGIELGAGHRRPVNERRRCIVMSQVNELLTEDDARNERTCLRFIDNLGDGSVRDE